MRISKHVYLVGSGKFGMEMTDPMDCNVYLLDCGGQFALIDAGGGVDSERIVQQIEGLGISMKQISHLLLTHVHADHAAGANFFCERYGLTVAVAEEAAEWLEQADREKTSLTHAIRGGVYPQDFHYPACPVGITVQDSDSIVIGDISLKVLSTPGHARGHMGFLWEEGGRKRLFSGDAVFAGGKVVIQYVWDCNIEQYAQTISKLHALNIDCLYPGHGPFILNRAHRHVAAAHDCFSRLEIPPNL
jgi:hydroxyacylglutathione hydrolase